MSPSFVRSYERARRTIQSVTFGFIYENFLGSDPTNAMMFSGALFLLAAIATTWVRPPRRQSPWCR